MKLSGFSEEASVTVKPSGSFRSRRLFAVSYLPTHGMGLIRLIALASFGFAFMLFVLRCSIRDGKGKPKMRIRDNEPPSTQPFLVKREHGNQTRCETRAAEQARLRRFCPEVRRSSTDIFLKGLSESASPESLRRAWQERRNEQRKRNEEVPAVIVGQRLDRESGFAACRC